MLGSEVRLGWSEPTASRQQIQETGVYICNRIGSEIEKCTNLRFLLKAGHCRSHGGISTGLLAILHS